MRRVPFTSRAFRSRFRNLGEDAVLAFVDGKHAGHIEAVANAPGRMMDTANIVWERARDNLARGAADMTPLELAKANALNALHATGIVMAEALQTAAVAGCIGMALEGVVSVTENLIYVYKDEMTPQQGGRRVLQRHAEERQGGCDRWGRHYGSGCLGCRPRSRDSRSRSCNGRRSLVRRERLQPYQNGIGFGRGATGATTSGSGASRLGHRLILTPVIVQ